MRTKTMLAVMMFSMAVALFVCTPAWAQTNNDPTVMVTETVLDKYLLRNGKVLYKRPVFQTDLNVQFKNGVYVDLWGSTGLNRKENFGREVDLTVGYANPHFDFGVSYYNLVPLQKLSGDLIDAYAEMRRTFTLGDHALTPYAKVDAMIVTKDTGRNSGFFGAIGARHAWQIHPRVSINESIELLYDSSIFGGDSGLVGRYDMGINVKLSKSVTVTPVVLKVSTPFTHMSDRHFAQSVGSKVTITW